MSQKRTIDRRTGFALLEVLIALVVLAFGMIGIAGMLLVAHKANSASYLKQQAVQSAYDIIDRVRANSPAAVSGSYNVNNLLTGAVLPAAPATIPPDCSVVACSVAQLAAYDVWYWLAKDIAQLPNGRGSVVTAAVATSNNTLVTVTVQWDDSPAQSKLGASTQTQGTSANLAQFTVQTLL
ncbi:type IV pilus modification protein PilV [Glaciimonas sp. CA11.2]|uniref:type IV pilus modification protein PilV n=1 Tax=unclassified Glaciimonas TaxID=2644401 RepID=UPI002AB3A926|nr:MULTISPECIES: type IV pilus modification protein PilV [unclassified Glaciimonas]MDY7546204.1 type IV pilus modification protein PilV [Glaciimonas sp. CA11.2]MEB0010846.1 type IV pilus modification protein PilV [Glaciimonas sp. Cout2]MEB0081627.1 type IV pilus modification protein PilV [Glaciimonas sp. Gout2]MEB0161734.1 type IV pilus modification protein PilV [Glaciimonas sp. CA11.2]